MARRHNSPPARREPNQPPAAPAADLPPSEPRRDAPSRRELYLVGVLALVAALRVWVFSAAFPFFNNVDEHQHFDVVVKYSHGHLPRGVEPFSRESAEFMVWYQSPEYLMLPEEFPGGRYSPPLWQYPADVLGTYVEESVARKETRPNYQLTEPPLYYALVGLWMNLGRWCGMADGYLLYWIRFLNVGVGAALVWIGYAVARQAGTDSRFVRLGVPLLLAVFPQDAYYSISNDVLSAVCFGLAFWATLCWFDSPAPSKRLGLAAGLSLAAAGLVKASNWPLIVVVLLALAIDAVRRGSRGTLAAAWPAALVLLVTAVLPIGAWLARNYYVLGDLTGSAGKAELQGISRRPLAQWGSHALFTPGGFYSFASELLASFWRGELVWQNRRSTFAAADVFYWVSSVVLIVIALGGCLKDRIQSKATQHRAYWLAGACVAASVGFLVLLSLVYDLQATRFAAEHPFFSSGRLMSGALIPFLLLYVAGLDRLLFFLRSDVARLTVLGCLALAILCSEFVLAWPAFQSAYNWYHLY